MAVARRSCLPSLLRLRFAKRLATLCMVRALPERLSTGTEAITPSRRMTQPALISRSDAPKELIWSQFPAGMGSSDAAGIAAISYTREAGIPDHRGKVFLIGELADGFHQILIAVTIAGHSFADGGNGIE